MSQASVSKPSFLVLLAAAGIALLLSLLTGLMGTGPGGPGSATVNPGSAALAQQVAPAKGPAWAAMAPGRVEPRGGETRLSAGMAGRVTELAVALNDVVQAGDLLLRIDDEEARARLIAADAEAAVRRRERDAEAAPGRLALDRRQAEDTVLASERAVLIARTDLDRTLRASRTGSATAADVTRERNALAAAVQKLDADRVTLRRTQTATGVPLPTRLEAGLTAARADVALAETALERTRLRAPGPGTVLQISPRIGETVAPSPEQVLIIFGDVSRLRVKAEVEERDVAKVRLGQSVVLRTDAFPGQDFTGVVASRAQALAPARLAVKGPRRPTDIDTLEVTIDVSEGVPLLPGMRVDVFFRAEAPPPPAPQVPPAPAPDAPKAK